MSRASSSYSRTDSARRVAIPPRRIAAVALLALGAAGLLLGGGKLTAMAYREVVAWSGMRLNRQAWEASYTERGLAVPPSGPRDGYWGARLGKHLPDPVLGWVLREIHLPGLLEVDSRGMQHAGGGPSVKARLLILGGSVAFGAYASSAETTYFHRLAELLARRSAPVDITVYAAGAWKSSQEITALELHGLSVRPDLVLFLDGLNDLTNGSNAHTLYGVASPTLDGSRWHPLYHEHDYVERVALYLENMTRARQLLGRRGIALVLALQPALFEKAMPSPLEERIERAALRPHGSKAVLQEAYGRVRAGLAGLAGPGGLRFVDCSGVFGDTRETSFTDLWHFADPGHTALAECLAAALGPVVAGRAGR